MKERVFNELTPEVEASAMMYAQGYEKKEIAEIKCRSITTVSNQISLAFDILQVRNGRELTRKMYERISGIRISMNYNRKTREFIAGCLLAIFSLTFFDTNIDMQRVRRMESRVRTERIRED